MPREVITPNPDSNVVSVGWQRGGTVQIATLPRSDELPAGWFADLNRNDLNRLIRLLRKARDQAYGTDA